jgi:TolC family type I secretion outer membrane protein
MRFRPLLLTLTLAAGAASWTGNAMAFAADDPFATDLVTPPKPQLAEQAETTYTPCPPATLEAVYGVVEVVDRALCGNPKTREAWANARVQAAQVGVAQSTFLPDLDGKLGASRNHSSGDTDNQRTASLALSWLIYDAGARSADLENARQLLAAAAATLDATVQTVFLGALQSYYNAQAARAAVTAAVESEKASRESLTAAEARYRVGTGTPADRLQAQTALSQATLDRIRAEGTLRTAMGTLANFMGFDAGMPLTLADLAASTPEASFERDVATLIDDARRLRPDLRAAEAQVLAAQANVESTRAAGRPTLSLGAGPSWVDSGNIASHSSSIGLTLSIPIFSGFDTTYRVRAAQARTEAAIAQRDDLDLQVALDVWSAYQSLITATQTIRSSADLLASAEQSERVALGRYRAGVGNILDVLNAQSALASARVQQIQSQLDWNISRATLAKAVGALDSRLLNPAEANRNP